MKRIFLTIDTECHDIKKENQYIWGIKGPERYGIEKIISIAKEFKIPLNFFVDIAEAKSYGDVFVKKIIKVIQNNGHKIYLHLHPNYISGDNSRTYLWEYSFEEQKTILKQGFEDYLRLTGKKKCAAFRIGRYGANKNMYIALAELGISTMDLSYCCNLPKKCKLSFMEIGVYNKPIEYFEQLLIPNTRYIGFDYFGKQKIYNCDVSEICYGEFVDILKNSGYQNIILTMHSWNLIRKYYFLSDYISGDYQMIKKFKKMIQYAKSNGYVFSDLEAGYKKTTFNYNDDILYNPVKKSIISKLTFLMYNFERFKKIAIINKRYFTMYLVFYFIIGFAIFTLLLLLF